MNPRASGLGLIFHSGNRDKFSRITGSLSLVLLTLAENVFKHGLKSTAAVNRLDISIKITNDKLEFFMENSKSETLGNSDNRQRPGIGLQNIVRRLTLHFQDDFIFATQDLPRTYRVNLIIPLGDQTR